VVDYLRAYSLRRPLFNKALLALVLTAGAAAALLFLARSGRATAFEPGRVHAWHAETACASCHSPWRGPDPALCSDCHARQREKGEIHQARQTFTPPCTGCHPEHRGGDRVTAADDTQCASCHRDLQVNPPGAEPRFARRVSAFYDDHPDFSVTLPSGVRLPLAEAVARRADPTPLRFNHQRHLRAGLPTPSGQRVQLRCESCHHLAAGAAGATDAAGTAGAAGTASAASVAGGAGTAAGSPPPGGGQMARPGGQPAMESGIAPITYEASCTTSGCHPLTFDNRRPDQVAPHASPQRVREFLVSVYSDRRGATESVGDQYRRLIRGAGAQARGIDYGGQAQGAVVLAERYLYGTACKECHVVDTNATPLPRVTWTPIPARWLPNGRFQHPDHPFDCQRCHAAAASTAAADVLLPAIAVCRTCHGGGGGAAQVKAGTAPAAPTDCLSCHRYHPGSPSPAQAALAPPPARLARATPPVAGARLDSPGSGI
jgi:predicted CXXCH cytochrome family protein